MTRSGANLFFLAVVIGIAAFWPSTAAAQGDTACDAVLDHVTNARQRFLANGMMHYYGSGDVRASCRGQDTSVRSDSIAWFEDRSRIDFTGDVRFQDTTVSLNADRAIYYLATERLEAFGNVRLVNSATGTVLTGSQLTYWRQVPAIRDTTELLATNRPTVEYRSTESDERDDPYIIVGNTIRLRGEEKAWSWGAVTIDRESFHAEADSAELDLLRYNGVLVGNAQVTGNSETSRFRILGLSIAFTSSEDELNWVQARDSARAESDEFTLTADTAEFHLVDGEIEGGVAWGNVKRATAVSERNTITADSLEIDTPGQQLTELRGFGLALATSVRDSLDEEGDWIGGDSLVAQFTEFQEGGRGLKELSAAGNAYALYRIYKFFGADPDINYSRGARIVAAFRQSGVDKVDVIGQADGIHLEATGISRVQR
ncbi:MAG: hypothetical protein OEZ54_03075 [Gemmatimonadota bacterium]|nr:hypothetical protein [Gemmatimonadota bacterium]